MPNYKKKSERRSFLKLASRIVCLVMLLILAAYLNTTRTARASLRISCSYDMGDGTVLVVSCGSSAGNLMYSCSQTTGQCDLDTYNNALGNLWANEQCELYDAAGGCDTSIGGGGIGGLMP